MTRGDELLCLSECVLRKIMNNRFILPFIDFTDNKRLEKGCKAIYLLQATVNKAIQTGNYRRAIRYILVLRQIEKEICDSKDYIGDRLTESILEQD